MKRTEPEHVSDLLQGMLRDKPLLKLAQAHEELSALWQNLPDPTFARMSVDIRLSTDGLIQVRCPSPVVLNYVRLKRPLIEECLKDFMAKHSFTRLEFSLKD